jgi:hypothetical protein
MYAGINLLAVISCITMLPDASVTKCILLYIVHYAVEYDQLFSIIKPGVTHDPIGSAWPKP